MANPELGAKQICPTCSTKFYDLTRRPAVCPKCGAEFDPEEALRNRRVRARALPDDDTEDEKKVVTVDAEADDGFGSEPDEAPELDAAVDDPPILSDDDSEEADAPAVTPGDGLGVDFAAEEDLEDADDEVPFIEDEDDDFPEAEIDLPPDETGEDR